MSVELGIGSELAAYRIEALLGRGGMGIVYLAEDKRLGRKVALKVLAPEVAGDERFRERFVRESRLAAAIDHSNIIPVYEAGEAEGLLYIAMRYVEGTDLKAVIVGTGPVDPLRVVSIVGQVAGALDAAHERGLVHRDVKPANILLTKGSGAHASEHAYLVDFGLTKRTDALSDLTKSGQFIGSVDYVAPEQIERKPVDGRSDVYSLGCVAYHALIGEVPFPADSELGTLWAHTKGAPPSATDRRPELPREVDAVVARAMAKAPADRYPTAGEFADALRDALRPAAETAPLPGDRRRRTAILTAIAGLVVATVAIVLALGGGEEPRSRTGGALLRIDPETGGVTWVAPLELPPFDEPPDVAVGEEGVWVIRTVDDQSGGRSLARLDPRTGETLATIPVQAEPGTQEVAVGDGAVWVVGGAALTLGPRTLITEVDPGTDKVTTRLELAGIEGRGVAVGEGAVWVLGTRGRVTKIDPTTGRAGETIVVGEGSDAIATGEGSVWVAAEAGFGNDLVRIDPDTMEVVDRVDLGVGHEDVAVGEGVVWLIDAEGTYVRRVDLEEEGLVSGRVYQTGSDPTDITVAFGSVWVVNEGDGTVSRIDPAAEKTTDIKVGGHPSGIAADEEGGTIWVVGT